MITVAKQPGGWGKAPPESRQYLEAFCCFGAKAVLGALPATIFVSYIYFLGFEQFTASPPFSLSIFYWTMGFQATFTRILLFQSTLVRGPRLHQQCCAQNGYGQPNATVVFDDTRTGSSYTVPASFASAICFCAKGSTWIERC
jgi:hypothetical protein